MSYMTDQARFLPVNGIQELSFTEVGQVDGGADAKVVATGAGIMASSLTIAACPPAAGAVATIGALVVLTGLLFD